MTLDEILASLFPAGHSLDITDTILTGSASVQGAGQIHVLGVHGKAFLGVDDAAILSGRVVDILGSGDGRTILLLIDSASQRMSRRDEQIGLNDYLAHLAKTLILASARGHRVIALLYGGSAAGAFIATALAADTLVALPGAHPEVMDLPSMARVTKLPIAVLEEKAKATPIFAPGLDNLAQTGAVFETWDPDQPLDEQFRAVLARPPAADRRDVLGAERQGRTKAAAIAARIVGLAEQGA
jgi:malonate decarboxylase gamma subunit